MITDISLFIPQPTTDAFEGTIGLVGVYAPISVDSAIDVTVATDPTVTDPSTTAPLIDPTLELASINYFFPFVTDITLVDPSIVDYISTDPTVTDPLIVDSTSTDPTATDPLIVDSTSTDPTATDPLIVDSASTDPTATDPLIVDSASIDPTAVDPSTVTPLIDSSLVFGPIKYFPIKLDIPLFDSSTATISVDKSIDPYISIDPTVTDPSTVVPLIHGCYPIYDYVRFCPSDTYTLDDSSTATISVDPSIVDSASTDPTAVDTSTVTPLIDTSLVLGPINYFTINTDVTLVESSAVTSPSTDVTLVAPLAVDSLSSSLNITDASTEPSATYLGTILTQPDDSTLMLAKAIKLPL